MRLNRIASGALCLFWAVSAWGGQVVFRNGDRLTGKVTQAADGKLTVESAVAGKVTVPMSEVQTFSTDEPVEMHLSDGTVLKQKVEAGEPGQVKPAGGAMAGQAVPIANLASINPPGKAQPWHGSIAVGAMMATGNTKSQDVNASADAIKRGEDDRLTLHGDYLFGRQSDRNTHISRTTADSFRVSGKYDYFLSDKLYVYGMGKVEKDRIAFLNIRLTPSAGIGYQWHESPVWNFNTEGGIGWTYQDFSNDGTNDYISGRLAYHYDRKLTDSVAFVHNVEYLPSFENISQFIFDADAGIRADLTAHMFSEFKVQWTYNSNPAPHALHNDVRYLASLGWRF